MLKSFGKKIISLFTAKPRMSKLLVIALVVFVLVGVLAVANPAKAAFFSIAIDSIAEGISNILLWAASLVGKLLVVVIDIMIDITQYNNFSNAEAVNKGWVVIRDISNMFFVLILLTIAFGTILKIENYKYSRLLAKLVIMAVLINFSKLIAGFFIDMAQVVMLTFVNAYAETAAANFTSILKLKNMLDILPSGDSAAQDLGKISNADLIAVPAIAIIMLIIALLVMLAILVVFLVRIIALWILVVLSPLAYILAVLPLGQKYSSQWWSTFGKWLTTGPILAFFLWLSLAVLTTSTDNLGVGVEENVVGVEGNNLAASISAVSSAESMLGFMLSVAMLMIALSVAGTLGGAAGGVASNIAGRIKGAGTGTLKLAAGIATSPFRGAKKAGAYGARSGGRYVARKIRESDSPFLNALTPEYWKGFAKRGQRQSDRAKKRVEGKGEFLAERVFKPKGAAMEREEMAERQIIVELKGDFNKEMGAAGESRQAMMDLARRTFLTGGFEGEESKQAFLELATEKGNLDDVFYAFGDMYHQDDNMRAKINKDFGQLGYEEHEVEDMFKEYNAETVQKFSTSFLGLDRSFTEGKKDKEGNVVETQHEVAAKSKKTDQRRLRALAGISEVAKDVGHWEQLMAVKDPSTGVYSMLSSRDRREEIVGEAKKRGLRDFLRQVAPHVVRQRTRQVVLDEYGNPIEDARGEYMKEKLVKEEDGTFKKDKDGDYLEMVHGEEVKARKYKHDYEADLKAPKKGTFEHEMLKKLFGGQHIPELRQMQSRIPDQLIAKYFDELGNRITSDEAKARGFNEVVDSDGKQLKSPRQVAEGEFDQLFDTNSTIIKAMYNLKYGGTGKADIPPKGGYPWEPGYKQKIATEDFEQYKGILNDKIGGQDVAAVGKNNDINVEDVINRKQFGIIKETLTNTDFAGQKGLIPKENTMREMESLGIASKWLKDIAKPGKEREVAILNKEQDGAELAVAKATTSEDKFQANQELERIRGELSKITGYWAEDVSGDSDRQYTTQALKAEAVIQREVEEELRKPITESVSKLRGSDDKTITQRIEDEENAAAKKEIEEEGASGESKKEIKDEHAKRAKQRSDEQIKKIVDEFMDIGAKEIRDVFQDRIPESPSAPQPPDATQRAQQDIDNLGGELSDLMKQRQQFEQTEQEHGAGSVPAKEKDDLNNSIEKIVSELGGKIVTQRDELVEQLKNIKDPAQRQAVQAKIDELNATFVNPEFEPVMPSAEAVSAPEVSLSTQELSTQADKLRSVLEESTGALEEFPKLSGEVSKTLNEFVESLGRASKDMSEGDKKLSDQFSGILKEMSDKAARWAVSGAKVGAQDQQQFMWSIVQLTKALKDKQSKSTKQSTKQSTDKAESRPDQTKKRPKDTGNTQDDDDNDDSLRQGAFE